MPPLLRTSPVRFDPALALFLPEDPSQVAGTPYSGFADRPGPQLPGDGVGYFHTPGSLAAMGLMARPTPGNQSVPFWEPVPGWNSPGGLIRRARLLCLMVDNDFLGEVGDRVDAVYPQLRELGVTVALVGSNKARLAPHSALVPARDMTFADAANPAPGQDQGAFFRLRPTYLETTFVGGRVMVAELNSQNWTRGGFGTGEANVSSGSGYAQLLVTILPVSAPTGGRLWPCGLGDSRIVTFGAEARADLAAAQPLADGCERYAHYVYQKNTPGSFQGIDLSGVDDNAIYADLTGSSALVTRRVVSAADPDEIWATFAADAVGFFSS